MTNDFITTERSASRRRRSRRWRAVAAASVLALAPLSLAACGGDDAAAGASSQAGAAGAEDLAAFQECLAENGVEMGAPPDQSGAEGGVEGGEAGQVPDRDAQAQEACADLAPEGMGQGGPGMGQGGPGGEELTAYVECLADNGVEVELPGSGGAPPVGEPPADGEAPAADEGGAPPQGGAMLGLDESDPEVAAAVEACADLAPEGPAGAAPTDGTSDGAGSDATESS
jgi:hypothetical protein